MLLHSRNTSQRILQIQASSLATGLSLFGQFAKALIEVSKEAGDAFSKHQVLIKLTWRGDTGAFRRDAFHRLVGITT